MVFVLQDSVYGKNYNEPGIGEKKTATGKKRPAPEDDPALKEALAEHDYKVCCSMLTHLQLHRSCDGFAPSASFSFMILRCALH